MRLGIVRLAWSCKTQFAFVARDLLLMLWSRFIFFFFFAGHLRVAGPFFFFIPHPAEYGVDVFLSLRILYFATVPTLGFRSGLIWPIWGGMWSSGVV